MHEHVYVLSVSYYLCYETYSSRGTKFSKSLNVFFLDLLVLNLFIY